MVCIVFVIQGVDTCICAILTAATRLGDPIYWEMGVAHRIAPYTTANSQSHCGILPKSQGHGCFSGRVTRSQPNFMRSQTVTPVAAVSIVHIGVTTPCDPCHQEYYYIHDTEARVSHYLCKVIVQRLCM